MKNLTSYWIEINIDEIYISERKTPLLKGQQLEVQMINGDITKWQRIIDGIPHKWQRIIIDGIPHKNLFLFKDKTYTISSLIGMNYISDITGQIERDNKLKQLGI
jgi:hypothetical protein